jgi:hypothetical protein
MSADDNDAEYDFAGGDAGRNYRAELFMVMDAVEAYVESEGRREEEGARIAMRLAIWAMLEEEYIRPRASLGEVIAAMTRFNPAIAAAFILFTTTHRDWEIRLFPDT